jgi:hypothetical protein
MSLTCHADGEDTAPLRRQVTADLDSYCELGQFAVLCFSSPPTFDIRLLDRRSCAQAIAR